MAPYQELLQVTHRFFCCLDERRYGELLARMSPEAVWHRQGKTLRGHPEILAALEERSKTQRIRQVITNAFLDETNGEPAELRAYMTAYRFDDGKPSRGPVVIDGPSRLSLVHTRFARRGGEWRIVEQSLTPESEFRAPGQAS
jgi:hypothetical protein